MGWGSGDGAETAQLAKGVTVITAKSDTKLCTHQSEIGVREAGEFSCSKKGWHAASLYLQSRTA